MKKMLMRGDKTIKKTKKTKKKQKIETFSFIINKNNSNIISSNKNE